MSFQLVCFPPCSALVLFFLFYCSGAHRDLPSFPTRRSSDLIACATTSARPSCTESRQKTSAWLYQCGSSRPETAPATSLDRKSTRLNSSHRCISYAVFCLKKKKKKKKTRTKRAPDNRAREMA